MDLIDRQEAIEAVSKGCQEWRGIFGRCEENILALPSAQPECDKKFMMLKVIDLNGRPYYSIIYLEDGREYEGYSSYDLMVISEYLKRYFGFAQPEIIRCRECKHWREDHTCREHSLVSPMMAYEFCSRAERR